MRAAGVARRSRCRAPWRGPASGALAHQRPRVGRLAPGADILLHVGGRHRLVAGAQLTVNSSTLTLTYDESLQATRPKANPGDSAVYVAVVNTPGQSARSRAQE